MMHSIPSFEDTIMLAADAMEDQDDVLLVAGVLNERGAAHALADRLVR